MIIQEMLRKIEKLVGLTYTDYEYDSESDEELVIKKIKQLPEIIREIENCLERNKALEKELKKNMKMWIKEHDLVDIAKMEIGQDIDPDKLLILINCKNTLVIDCNLGPIYIAPLNKGVIMTNNLIQGRIKE